MDHFEIKGGKKLKGEIDVRGSKNATTPILAATLLTRKECILSNIPLIEDVFRMIEILQSMGVEVRRIGERKISVKADQVHPEKIDVEKVKQLRSSILLLGSLSARFDKFKLYHPGGCVIGKRPVGTHFDALRKMGIEIVQKEKFYLVNAKKRKSAKVVLREMSVTATENAMMLAAMTPGKTVLKICATEPHVEDLGKFLVSMGARIKGLGTHTLEITGTKNLRGAKHTIIPDANEAATFLIMGVVTGSPIRVKNAVENHLDLVLEKLREFGADFKIGKDYIEVVPAKKLQAISKIDTRTYPGIPSDVQAPFGILATQAQGETLMYDTLFEGRFNYIGEIKRMGANANVVDAHQVMIAGPTKLKGQEIKSFDLRAGASLIIAALLAQGKTIIKDIYQVDRGYERIEERLQKLGADIRRIKS
ncbi:MAG: UDP-N-acetylglucosamine 1-carboxyvinyltransferase [Candidatus Moranbacteria bacterium CG23_combo_of_CG06-09_8_20_14_all_39_10]|nr:MAG: UDP-N-acetylglucosamine 1-carboxyvinyltransferase [Candidatus Moranbacteria bacterium CG23_combo_of_CG06-09_8_20_14_all_39_10]